MELVPKTQIVSPYEAEKKQKEKFSYKQTSVRKNNRKSTRGRHTQTIIEWNFATFPPKRRIKTIKHLK